MAANGQSADKASLRESFARARRITGVRGSRLAALAATSIAGAVAEAGVLVLIVRIAVALAAGDEQVTIHGPFGMSVELTVGGLLAVAFGLALVRALIHVITAHQTARVAADCLGELRTSTYQAFVEASWAMQSSEREGHLQELLTTHVNRISTSVLVLVNGLVSAFAFLALIASAFVVDVVSAGAVLLATGLLFVALRPISRLGRRQALAQRSANLDYVQAVSETVNLALETRTFDVGDERRERTARLVDAVVQPFYRAQFLFKLLPGLYQSAALMMILAGFVAALSVDSSGLGSLGASVLLLVRALSYSQSLQATLHMVHELGPYTEQLLEQRDIYRAAAVRRHGDDLTRVQEIEFRDVWFSYLPGRPVLRAMSFAVAAGETVGVVGPSGGGKSTLLQVLLQLRTPEQGALLINGAPADSYSLESWYQRIAFLPQDSHLLTGTIAENIRFLRPGISDDAIETAARDAGIHDEIVAWPLGYATVIGDRGVVLSGGQRQRLCLARALAGHPDVLVLDEPTSALDARSEALVQESLERLKGHVTLFIVAHRLSTLAVCDRIMVIERGELRSFDTAASLLDSSDYYREATALWQLR